MNSIVCKLGDCLMEYAFLLILTYLIAIILGTRIVE